MAFSGFVRKVWQDRVSEFPLRRRLTDTTSGVSQQVTVARDEGTVTTQGDTFDAANMNGLEARIASSFTEDEAAIGNLANLTTTEKSNLVGALNEVKASVPTFVPESLGDLDNVQLSTSGIPTGSVLSFDGNDSKWKNKELPASDVTFSAGQIVQSTNVQNAIDFIAGEMDAMQTNKVDVDDFFFKNNEEFSLQNGLFAGSLSGASKDVYIFIPLPKSTAKVTSCTVSGNWYVRGATGQIIANQALSSVGTVATPIFCAGGVQLKVTLTTASSQATNTALTALGWTNCKLKFSA